MMMKRFLCTALMLALMLPAASGGAAAEAKPQPDLASRMLKVLYEQNGQFVCSPLSLELALRMAAEGAAGDTRAELLNLLGVSELKSIKLDKYKQLRAANAAIVSDKIALLDAYKSTLEKRYQAQITPMGSDVVAQVNAWVSEHTDGMIDPFLTEQPSELLRLALLNALTLDADWLIPFDANITAGDVFHAPDGDVTVPFMSCSRSLQYAQAEGCQLVRLPYANQDLEMLLILPEEGGLDAALARIAQDGLSWARDWRWPGEVHLRLPKVSMASDLDIKKALQAMDVNLPFASDADFSGITKDERLLVDAILQKARIDVDEEGTKAGAVTGMMMVGKGLVTDWVEMTMDRPFIAIVRGAKDGDMLFAAVVTNPTKQ